MHLTDLKGKIPDAVFSIYENAKLAELRPCQEKALNAGLLDNKSLVVCTPTGSGKTFVAELALVNIVLTKKSGKVVYLAPLKALATEKYKQFKQRYGHLMNIALSIGDLDRPEHRLAQYDVIIATSEKLDSVIRHTVSWVKDIRLIIVDEIHLLNDPERGPTLEILLTLLRRLLKKVQIIGLSATIGNPEELAGWLDAKVVLDNWRPVELKKGIHVNDKVYFGKEFHKLFKQ